MNISVFNDARNEGYNNICSLTCYKLLVIPNLVLETKSSVSGPGASEKITLNARGLERESSFVSYHWWVLLWNTAFSKNSDYLSLLRHSRLYTLQSFNSDNDYPFFGRKRNLASKISWKINSFQTRHERKVIFMPAKKQVISGIQFTKIRIELNRWQVSIFKRSLLFRWCRLQT